MVDLYELKQLTAFADLGTLSKVAEEFHISTPSITRAMQHLEQYFGVPLFTRSKNKIELNETGHLAVEHARKLLAEAEQAVSQVRAFDQRQRTIVVRSCAPAPLWELLKALNAAQPEKMVASAICQNNEVLCAWQDGSCDIAILPFPLDGATPFMLSLIHILLHTFSFFKSFFLHVCLMDGSAIHRAAAVFTAAGCIWCGGCTAVGAGDCRFGRGGLLDLLPHIPADLRQNLPDLLAELFVIAVLNIGLRIAAGRHAGTHCGRWCDVHRAGVELEAHFVKIGVVDEYSDVKIIGVFIARRIVADLFAVLILTLEL